VLGALLLKSVLLGDTSSLWSGASLPQSPDEDESHSELCAYQPADATSYDAGASYSPSSSASASQIN